MSDLRKIYADKIADYVETHTQYDKFTKRDAVKAAVIVMTSDIGAATDFLKVIGLDIDLYTSNIGENNGTMEGDLGET